MTTAISKPNERFQELSHFLGRMKPQLQSAVPRMMKSVLTPDRLVRIMLTTWQTNSKIQDCSVLSLCGTLMRASQLGLDVDPELGHAYLVPFRNKHTGQKEVQLIIGYKGFIELAVRSGKIRGVPDGDCVYDGDHFEYMKGTRSFIEHRRGNVEEDSKLLYSWAIVRFPDDPEGRFEVVTRAKIDKTRAQSKAANDGPWVTHFAEMALKTAYRRLLKKLSLTPELNRVIEEDENVEAGLKTSEPPLLIEGQAVPGQSKSDALADKLGAPKTNGPKAVVETPGESTPPDEMFDQDATAKADLLSDLDDRLNQADTVEQMHEIGADMTKHKAALGDSYALLLSTFQKKFRMLEKKTGGRQPE